VVVEVGQVEADQAVHLVEHHLQLGQLWVEKLGELVLIDELSHNSEGQVLLVVE